MLNKIKSKNIAYLPHVLMGEGGEIIPPAIFPKRRIEGRHDVERNQLSCPRNMRGWTDIQSPEEKPSQEWSPTFGRLSAAHIEGEI